MRAVSKKRACHDGGWEKRAEAYLVQSVFLLLRLFAATGGVVDGVHELVGLGALLVVEAAAGRFENAVHGLLWVSWCGGDVQGEKGRFLLGIWREEDVKRKMNESFREGRCLCSGDEAVF